LNKGFFCPGGGGGGGGREVKMTNPTEKGDGEPKKPKLNPRGKKR